MKLAILLLSSLTAFAQTAEVIKIDEKTAAELKVKYEAFKAAERAYNQLSSKIESENQKCLNFTPDFLSAIEVTCDEGMTQERLNRLMEDAQKQLDKEIQEKLDKKKTKDIVHRPVTHGSDD